MTKLILTRHGQSVWNAENRFTGWVDVDLSDKGIDEAEKSGQIIKDLNISIDISYTSYLKRAIKTLTTILKKNNLELKFNTAWQLNERHYGSLTGLNKEETKKKIGEEQFMRTDSLDNSSSRNIWRGIAWLSLFTARLAASLTITGAWSEMCEAARASGRTTRLALI